MGSMLANSPLPLEPHFILRDPNHCMFTCWITNSSKSERANLRILAKPWFLGLYHDYPHICWTQEAQWRTSGFVLNSKSRFVKDWHYEMLNFSTSLFTDSSKP